MADIVGIGVAGHHPPPAYQPLSPKHAAKTANPVQPGTIVGFSGVDLPGVNLGGVNLGGVNLVGNASAATRDAKAVAAVAADQADAALPDNVVDVDAGFDKSLAAARFGQVVANRDAAAESGAAMGGLSRALVSASYLGIAMPTPLGPDAAPDGGAPANPAAISPAAAIAKAAASARHSLASLHAHKAAVARAPSGINLLA